MIPARTSAGGITTRPSVSASNSSVAPISAEAISARRREWPATIRASGGTISPRKAIGPATATAAPVQSVTTASAAV